MTGGNLNTHVLRGSSLELSTYQHTHTSIATGIQLCSTVFCLFVCGFSSHSDIFHSYVDVIIAGQGPQILTYVGHSWSLSIEGSLA